ncbi:MAG: signal recognition particle-docking protein FtsY [Candidatus Coatesbacteria bacterium]|nr:signal recognition particle-docking protein FtsY [Candidatus Coatesbacteria bacterium]
MRIFGFGAKKSEDDGKKSAEGAASQVVSAEVVATEDAVRSPRAVEDSGQQEPSESQESLRSRLAKGLFKTREKLSASLARIFLGAKRMSPELIAELEEALILADVGVDTVEKIVSKVSEDLSRRELSKPDVVKNSVKQAIIETLSPSESKRAPSILDTTQRPYVSLVVGVNGTGKTTTIAKLAHRYKKMGITPILVAADTFREAAIEQLSIWGERAGVEVIAHKQGASPAAVVFDGIAAAKSLRSGSRRGDVVIIDTAGRLHTKKNLMAELAKVRRVAAANAEGAPHETLLVLDATLGQNAVSQAKQFNEWLEGITGIVLTKIDGTAKGGVVVTIADELRLPILFLGTGEKLDDLVEFDANAFVDALLEG